jgi:hypothetical protein
MKPNLMIKPERLSYEPAPQMTPERIFVDPVRLKPGGAPPVAQQSPWAGLIGSISQGITSGISLYSDLYKSQGQNTLGNLFNQGQNTSGSIFGNNYFPSSVPSYLSNPVFGTNG